MTCDVFISYCKEEIELTKQLARILDDKGFSVWWDNGLLSGDDFTSIIEERLQQCKAAIVIWTPASVKRRFVRAEAKIADEMGKLVPVRVKDLMPRDIPPPYNLLHTELLDNIDAIVASLARLEIKPKVKQVVFPKGIFSKPLVQFEAPPQFEATPLVRVRSPKEDEELAQSQKQAELETRENLRAGGARRELAFKEFEVFYGRDLANPDFGTHLYETLLHQVHQSGSLEATEEFHKHFYPKLAQSVRDKSGKQIAERLAGYLELIRLKNEQGIFELAKFYVDEVLTHHPNAAVEVKLREDFQKKSEELAALVGSSFQDSFRQKVRDLRRRPKPQPPQTIWQRFIAMFRG